MRSMWINGKWVKGKGRESIKVLNPANETILDAVPNAMEGDADLAVESARRAFHEWRFMPGVEKARHLHEIARNIREKNTELARTMTLEGGKPYCENYDEVEWTAACFDYYAEIGRNSRGSSIPPVAPHEINFTVKEPYGVVVAIVPWNYPLLLLSWKVAPALAAGNTVIIKPSVETPLATLDLAEAFSGLPPGVVNIVTGRGREAGEYLVRHPGTDLIAMTGSTETGRRIGKICADMVKKTHLELGGKDPFIVCGDADVRIAACAAAWAAFLNAGQVCTSAERFYVFGPIYNDFIREMVKFTHTLKIGDGMDPKTDVGPMIGESGIKKVQSHIDDAVRKGAKIVCGGRRPPGLKHGFFYEPTILTGVNHRMKIMTEETFGPVAPVMKVKNLDEAIRLANDSNYGLGANIYTNNMEWAMRAADRVTAGTFWINDPLTDNDAAPFGGMRQTGHCRELGEEGLDEFRETKHVHLDYKQELKSYWYPYSKRKDLQWPKKK